MEDTKETGETPPASAGPAKRGAFILFEGVDRCGKTTQANLLVESLKDAGHDACFMRFPDRTTPIGQMINGFLQNTTDIDDRCVHLLFSANRWEAESKIRERLMAGTTIVCDRYAYSGVAFSASKPGLEVGWCKDPDRGLPAPDKILFLDISVEGAMKRGQFGEERYEKAEFQRTVRATFLALMEEDKATGVEWQLIDANRAVESIQDEIKQIATSVTKLAVIQDDILAVKHALANNLSFEGLAGEQLNDVLETLLAQRAEEASTTAAVLVTTTSGSSSASPCSSNGSTNGGGGGHGSGSGGGSSSGSSSNTISRIPVNGAAPKPAAGRRGKKRPAASSSPAPKAKAKASSSPAASNKTSSAPRKASPPAAAKAPAAPKTPAPEQRRQASSAKAAKKTRTPGSGPADRLRQIRKGIKKGDVVSVLTDVNIGGIWEKEWVEGEVIREMNRSGIFLIAFDHDRYGTKSAVKQEPSPSGTELEEGTDRRIHEQRLQIEHPQFFCGRGADPPVGIDSDRPRGAWYLHLRTAVQRRQQQEQEEAQEQAQEQAQTQPQAQEREQPAVGPVLPPQVGCSRTPHNLCNGSGGQSSSIGSTSISPPLSLLHVAGGGPVSHGDGIGGLGSSSAIAAAAAAAAAATQASADATDSE
eukprot:g6535.t1